MSYLYLNNRSFAIINAWLEETQSAIPQTYQHPASNTGNRSPSPCPSSLRQRITLASAEGIAMNSPKRNADHDEEEPSTPKRRQTLIHSENTAHASPTQMYLASSNDPGSSDRPATPSSFSVSQSSKPTSSSRASPVKGFRSLLMTENPVVRSNTVSEIPSMGRDLYTKLTHCRSAFEVIPRALKDTITEMSTDDFLHDMVFTPSWADIDLHAELAQMKDIMARSEKCRLLQDAEPGWNEQVHCRVLELALKDQPAVGFQNITTAKISPPTLQTKNVNGSRMGGGMVDYAICLEADLIEPMFNRIMYILRMEPPDSQYINHTAFEPVRFRPIAVSIESKTASGNEAEAITQLSVWVVAHFKRLQGIIKRSGVTSEMPVLPLINIQGEQWIVSLAVQRGNKTTMYGRVPIGSTDTILDFYKLVTGLRVLQQWANTEYRDWFNRILGTST